MCLNSFSCSVKTNPSVSSCVCTNWLSCQLYRNSTDIPVDLGCSVQVPVNPVCPCLESSSTKPLGLRPCPPESRQNFAEFCPMATECFFTPANTRQNPEPRPALNFDGTFPNICSKIINRGNCQRQGRAASRQQGTSVKMFPFEASVLVWIGKSQLCLCLKGSISCLPKRHLLLSFRQNCGLYLLFILFRFLLFNGLLFIGVVHQAPRQILHFRHLGVSLCHQLHQVDALVSSDFHFAPSCQVQMSSGDLQDTLESILSNFPTSPNCPTFIPDALSCSTEK